MNLVLLAVRTTENDNAGRWWVWVLVLGIIAVTTWIYFSRKH